MSETFTLSSAARWAGVSQSTMRRRLHAGAISGATYSEITREWTIPRAGLEGAGLVGGIEQAPSTDLRAQVAEAEQRAAVAEAVLAARIEELEHARADMSALREIVAAQTASLAMLSGRVSELSQRAALPMPEASRRWWRRSTSAPDIPGHS